MKDQTFDIVNTEERARMTKELRTAGTGKRWPLNSGGESCEEGESHVTQRDLTCDSVLECRGWRLP